MGVRTSWFMVLSAITLDILVYFVRIQLGWEGKGVHFSGLAVGLVFLTLWMQRASRLTLSKEILDSFEEYKQRFDLPEMRLKLVAGNLNYVSGGEGVVYISEKALRELSHDGQEFLVARELAGFTKPLGLYLNPPRWLIPLLLIGFFTISLVSHIVPAGIIVVASLILLIFIVLMIYEKLTKKSLDGWQIDLALAKDYLALQAGASPGGALEAIKQLVTDVKQRELRLEQIESFEAGKPRKPYSSPKIEERMSSTPLGLSV